MAELSLSEKFYIEQNRSLSEKEIAANLGLRVTSVRKHLKGLPPVAVNVVVETPAVPAKKVGFAHMFIQKTKDKGDNVIVATQAASSLGDDSRGAPSIKTNPNVFVIPKND